MIGKTTFWVWTAWFQNIGLIPTHVDHLAKPPMFYTGPQRFTQYTLVHNEAGRGAFTTQGRPLCCPHSTWHEGCGLQIAHYWYPCWPPCSLAKPKAPPPIHFQSMWKWPKILSQIPFTIYWVYNWCQNYMQGLWCAQPLWGMHTHTGEVWAIRELTIPRDTPSEFAPGQLPSIAR